MGNNFLQQSEHANGTLLQAETMARYDLDIQRRRFFGQVVLTYEDGRLVNLKETRNLKPDQLAKLIAESKP
jgi:hypothetical protein